MTNYAKYAIILYVKIANYRNENKPINFTTHDGGELIMSGGVVRLDSDSAKICATCVYWYGDVGACIEDASTNNARKIRILDDAFDTKGICRLKDGDKQGKNKCIHHKFR